MRYVHPAFRIAIVLALVSVARGEECARRRLRIAGHFRWCPCPARRSRFSTTKMATPRPGASSLCSIRPGIRSCSNCGASTSSTK